MTFMTWLYVTKVMNFAMYATNHLVQGSRNRLGNDHTFDRLRRVCSGIDRFPNHIEYSQKLHYTRILYNPINSKAKKSIIS